MDACVEWPGHRDKDGYGKRKTDGDPVPKYAHRVVWKEEYGPIPEGLCVLHKCDNPPCYNANHLFLGTHADNRADAQNKGRFPKTAHGKRQMYERRGCRCDKCRTAHAKRIRDYRRKANG